jgi:hypothetical protein
VESLSSVCSRAFSRSAISIDPMHVGTLSVDFVCQLDHRYHFHSIVIATWTNCEGQRCGTQDKIFFTPKNTVRTYDHSGGPEAIHFLLAAAWARLYPQKGTFVSRENSVRG